MKNLLIPLLLLAFGLTCMSSKSPEEYAYIDIVYFGKQPIVAGTLNGRPAYFMLDSGAKISLLEAGKAQQYRFATWKSDDYDHHTTGIGGRQSAIYMTGATKLMLGPQRIKNRLMATQLSHLFRTFGPYRPVGIMGADVMEKYGLIIDYGQQRVGIPLTSSKKEHRKKHR